MSRSLEGKAAIVTGASSGIGRATAIALAEAGAAVTLLARREEALNEVAATIDRGVEPGRGRTLAIAVDVCDEQGLIAAFDRSQKQWGRLDILVNAAGLGLQGSLRDGATEDWRRVLEVNVLAVAVATREALKRFDGEDSEGDAGGAGDAKSAGHVVHISSMSGHRVPRRGAMYAASKFAVRAMTEALRCELRDAGSHARVTSISPGFVDTGFFNVFYRGDQAQIDELRSRYKFLDPADIADAVLHAVTAPPHVGVHDILLRPNEQPT